MSPTIGIVIESLVAALLFVTIAYCIMLNKRLNETTTYELRGGGGQFSSQRNSLTEQFNTAGVRTLTQLAEGDAKDRSFNIAGKIARAMLDGAPRLLTHGATHFHTRNVRPGWAHRMPRTASIGAHFFYRVSGGG